MPVKMMLAIWLVLLTLQQSSSQSMVWPRNPKVYANKGDSAELVCSSNYQKKYCAFTAPMGMTFTMNNEWDIEDRFHAFRTDSSNSRKECAVRIDGVLEKDEG